MSVSARVSSLSPRAAAPPALPGDRLERLWAWGLAASAMGYVYRPRDANGVREALETARAHGVSVGLRGAGCSYGDASLNAERIVLDLTRMDRILEWDPGAGVARVEPGVTIGQLWRRAVEDGWWPAVVPGTMFPTVGGCAAMNIHGKNNWAVGPIGDHIVDFELLLPTGEVRRCSREREAGLFHAAIGGFGMLGCFLSLTLRMKKIHSGLLSVQPLSVRDLGEMIAVFEDNKQEADYLVGWVDAFAGGPRLGRGLIHLANYLAPGEDPEPSRTLRAAHQELPDTLFGVLPKAALWRLMRPFVNDPGIRLVNSVKHHSSRLSSRRYLQSHAAFAFLLDYVPDWKLAYTPGGLIQYQSFIPAARAAEVFRAQLKRCQERGHIPYLAVLKRHRPDAFLMTHALDGFSLALDFPVTPSRSQSLWALTADLDRAVLEAGGRFYFAKDSTLSHARLGPYLEEERVRRFLALKRECDPDGLLETDLYRRLFLSSP
jgi:decaprenylphospho-beta-D-ribofuranose 2-oxidase